MFALFFYNSSSHSKVASTILTAQFSAISSYINTTVLIFSKPFNMWFRRRILSVSWIAHIPNVDALRKMKKGRKVNNAGKIRKLQYLGHLMRNEQRFYLLQSIQLSLIHISWYDIQSRFVIEERFVWVCVVCVNPISFTNFECNFGTVGRHFST